MFPTTSLASREERRSQYSINDPQIPISPVSSLLMRGSYE
ncbi:hypothetical protein PDIG_65000 [Penicillium digitatum PHI26]|uniref:Uncharacterized protein n=2 Tax=Penicillium digitatum TaxID=36651 RepID=K9G5W5_PEND2|nr:hypothetical protein PDIP_74330 [Penicillium digitatum Pd1]EKV07342.1 hypothetical protein PDIP_74330 [Penicillium digitatum Pd1]EKV08636.1 hypothetical protein PDIG_65000 [Penicillium digitatum PHI26]